MLSGGGGGTADAVARLFAARPIDAAEWGLDRIRALLEALGNPQSRFESLHVAGTNGKGSTATFAAAILQAGGYVTGLYTSPHLEDVRERFLVNGLPVAHDVLAGAAVRIAEVDEAVRATYFEVATALAFEAFAETGVGWVVAETGLGGRLDATNALTPRACCITTIGFDHADVLGETLEDIAREKAGIFKAGVPAAIGDVLDSARDTLEAVAGGVGTPLLHLGRDAEVDEIDVSLRGTRFRYRSDRWPAGLALRTPMVGAHQARNAGTALLSIEAAGVVVTGSTVERALAGARVPGRFEVRREAGATWVLDVAHNREGLEAVLEAMRDADAPRPRVALVSILADKPWSGMLGMLRLDMDAIILTQTRSSPEARRWDLEEVAAAAESGADLSIEPALERAVERARSLARGGTVLVTGSVHTVGEAGRILAG